MLLDFGPGCYKLSCRGFGGRHLFGAKKVCTRDLRGSKALVGNLEAGWRQRAAELLLFEGEKGACRRVMGGYVNVASWWT